MNSILGSILVPTAWIGMLVGQLHGLYLSYHESFTSLIIAFVIPPWAIIKGLIGFF